MIRNNLKTAVRTMRKNRLFTAINLFGLVLGLFSCLMVFTVVMDDLSYDRFWSKSDRLYRLYTTSMINNVETKEVNTTVVLANELRDDFPEVEAYSRVIRNETAFRMDSLSTEEVRVKLFQVDTAFTSMFDIRALSGSVAYVEGVRNLVITESLKKTHFPDSDPVGTMIYDVPGFSFTPTSNGYLITAVIEDIPQNTHLRAEALQIIRPSTARFGPGGQIAHHIYYQLHPAVDLNAFSEKIQSWYKEKTQSNYTQTYTFQPVPDIYLNSEFDQSLAVKSNRTNLIIFGVVGGLLLTIACINFMNLSTARMMRRLKETGLRKILGADRNSLVMLYLCESLILFALATVLSLALYFAFLPVAEAFIGNGLTRTFFSEASLLFSVLAGISVLSILIGIYPAWVMSGFSPAESIRNQWSKGRNWQGESLRKGLVVFQFSLAIVVLVSFVVVKSQINLINSKDLGYEPDDLIMVQQINWDSKFSVLKNEVSNTAGVARVGSASWIPGRLSMGRSGAPNPQNPDETFYVNMMVADLEFAETVGLKMQSGRYPNQDFGADRHSTGNADQTENTEPAEHKESILLTEQTAAAFQVSELNTMIPGTTWNPVGVFQDLNHESLHTTATPVGILLGPNFAGNLYIRTEPGQKEQVAQSVARIWSELFPNNLLNMYFVDEMVDELYEAENKQQTLIMIFGSLMLVLSALGVFGLIVHHAELRTKEIGIRKVLGASVQSLVQLLSMDFVKLVVIAVIVASPAAWWIMNRWLENFAYRVEIAWWMFAVAGLIAVSVALFTAGIHAYRTASINPVHSLKND